MNTRLHQFAVLFFVCALWQPASATTIVHVGGTGQIGPAGSLYNWTAPGFDLIFFGDGPFFIEPFGATDCIPRCLTQSNRALDLSAIKLTSGLGCSGVDCNASTATPITTPGLDFQTLAFTTGPTQFTLPLHFEVNAAFLNVDYRFIGDGLWTITTDRSCAITPCDKFAFGQDALVFTPVAEAAPVPEPATWLLLLSGVVGLLLYQHRRTSEHAF